MLRKTAAECAAEEESFQKGMTKMEKERIGKAVLDYRFYSGEDTYTDGAIEDEMLEIAKNCEESEYERIIREKKSWPILYHFSALRENIISWLPIQPTEQVLEIGCGPGAITGALCRNAAHVTCIDLSRKRCLINAYRHKDCENLTFLVGNFQDIEPKLEQKYDLITLIGVLEYAQFSIQGEDPFAEYLARIRSHLAPGGRLVIAIENRIGLKYWAGATEDHTGDYFEGLEGYPTTDYVRTFSKPELETLLDRAGFQYTEFYYPYPDYKFPEQLYSAASLPKKGELNRNRQNFDRERMQLFSEERVYDTLLESGLFEQFSNSFFVIAHQETEAESQRERIRYVKYSNERAEAFRIRTQIEQAENGCRQVRKLAVCDAADAHIQSMVEKCRALEADLAKGGISVNQIKKDGSGMVFPFLQGKTLEERLDGLLAKKDWDALEAEIGRYFAMFSDAEEPFVITDEFRHVFGEVYFDRPQLCRSVSDVDMIFSNAVCVENGYELIDYEWTFAFPIPVRFLQYRCLHYYLLGNVKRDALLQRNLYEKFGITESECRIFAAMEQKFQSYILGTYVPIWKLYDDISEGVLPVLPMVEKERQKSHAMRRVEVYFDDGRGFGTWSWKKYQAAPEGEVSLKIELPKGTRSLRIDPCAAKSVVRIKELTQKGYQLSVQSNGEQAPNGDYIFDTEDPQLVIPVLPYQEGVVEITFFAEPLTNLVRETLLAQNGRIRWMEQTKAWKLYQKLKPEGKK